MSELKLKIEPDPIDVHVGLRVKQQRIHKGMDQTQFGEALGVTFLQVQKYENGTNRISAGNLFRMAEVLGVEAPYFFEGLPETSVDDGLPTLEQSEAVDFLYNFRRIPDPDVGKGVFKFTKTMAEISLAKTLSLEDIHKAISATGLTYLGAFHPGPGDGAPKSARTLVLVGNAGPQMWNAFSANRDDDPDPLDAWTRRALTKTARKLGAEPLFTFGKPYIPVGSWARQARIAHTSPLKMLIHPEFGLWHAYRGALAFKEKLDLPMAAPPSSPCESCPDQPCLSACPVGSFSKTEYDESTCVGHISKPAGADCLSDGCVARHACPVGAEYAYAPVQARFHMEAFRESALHS